MLIIKEIPRKNFNVGIFDDEKKEFVQVCASKSEAKRVLAKLQSSKK